MKKKKAWQVYEVTKSNLNKSKYRNIYKIYKTKIMLLKNKEINSLCNSRNTKQFFSLLIISLAEANHQL